MNTKHEMLEKIKQMTLQKTQSAQPTVIPEERKSEEEVDPAIVPQIKFTNMKKKYIKNFLQLFLNYNDYYMKLLGDLDHQKYYIATQCKNLKNSQKNIFNNNAKIINTLNKIKIESGQI